MRCGSLSQLKATMLCPFKPFTEVMLHAPNRRCFMTVVYEERAQE